MNTYIYREFVGKRIKIFLKGNLFYETSNLQILNEDKAVFNDRKGIRVLISLNDIEKIVEVRG